VGLFPDGIADQAALRLRDKLVGNEYRMSTGILGTRALLPALSAHGQHDLAVRLFQSHRFPSWGYEVVNGATTVWERWDSYTKEHGFEGLGGGQNASMNSFSHYAFGAVMEWAYRALAGIDTEGPGFKRILISPGPPDPGCSSNSNQEGTTLIQVTHSEVNAGYGNRTIRLRTAGWSRKPDPQAA
jgi:alpha-L-rhamnosidase